MLLDKLVVAIEADISKLQSGLAAGQKSVGKFGSGVASLTASATAGSTVIAGAVAAAGLAFVGLATLGEQSLVADKRLGQINKSMGLFGKETQHVTDRLLAYSDTLARSTGVDDDIIKGTQAKLLTFKELAKTADTVGGSFDRATTAAVDMAAAGFGSAEGNAVQLGKAMNDPIKGITALNKSGITFTQIEKDKVKAMVESGHTLEAQDFMLKAIEKQVGGTAAATATNTAKMQYAFGEMAESIGVKLLPAFDAITGWITNSVVPAVQSFVDNFDFSKIDPAVLVALGGALMGALYPALVAGATALWAMFAPLIPFIAAGALLGLAVDALVKKFGGWGAIKDKAVAAFNEIKDAFGFLMDGFTGGGDPAALTGPMKSMYDAGVQLREVFNSLKEVAVTVFNALKAQAGPVIEQLKVSFGKLMESMGPAIESMKTAWDQIKPALTTVAQIVGGILAVAFGILVGTINGVIQAIGPLLRAIGGIVAVVMGVFNLIVGLVTGDGAKISAALSGIGQGIVDVFAGLWGAISGQLTGFIDGVVGFFTGLYDTLVGHSIIPDTINGIVTWFDQLPGRVGAAVSRLITTVVTFLRGLPAKAIAGIGALSSLLTSKGRDLINGLWSGAKAIWASVVGWVKAAPGNVVRNLGNVDRILYSAGSSIISGFWNGLKSMWSSVTGWVSGIATWIRAHKGPISYDRALLVDAGVAIMQGLMNGLESQLDPLGRTLAKITGAVAGTSLSFGDPSMSLPISATAAFAGAGMASGSLGRGSVIDQLHLHLDNAKIDSALDIQKVGEGLYDVFKTEMRRRGEA